MILVHLNKRYMTKVFVMQFISCCGIQASEVVLIVSIGTVESYVGKSTAGKNTGVQNWRNRYGNFKKETI